MAGFFYGWLQLSRRLFRDCLVAFLKRFPYIFINANRDSVFAVTYARESL